MRAPQSEGGEDGRGVVNPYLSPAVAGGNAVCGVQDGIGRLEWPVDVCGGGPVGADAGGDRSAADDLDAGASPCGAWFSQ